MSKLESIRIYFKNHKIKCIDKLDDKSIDIIYDLCINSIHRYNLEISSLCANYIGLYYKCQNDLDNAIKYFKIAAEQENIYAMTNLAKIYKKKKMLKK